METLKDFWLTVHPTVLSFAKSRAVLMFGKDWEIRSDLVVSHPTSRSAKVTDIKQDGLALEVHKFANIAFAGSEVSCKIRDRLEDPAENIPAQVKFYSAGKKSQYTHYSAGEQINPPNGAPATVDYDLAGNVRDCWYVPADKTHASFRATPEEVAERMAGPRQAAAAKLCSASQDIMTLRAGDTHQSPCVKALAALLP